MTHVSFYGQDETRFAELGKHKMFTPVKDYDAARSGAALHDPRSGLLIPGGSSPTPTVRASPCAHRAVDVIPNLPRWTPFECAGAGSEMDTSGTPQPQLALNLKKRQAPALVRLEWSGRIVCDDACNLRFVVDGQPTRETADAAPFLYPRDGVLRDATVHDFAVMGKGDHVIGLQCSTQGRFEMRDWVITADATPVQ